MELCGDGDVLGGGLRPRLHAMVLRHHLPSLPRHHLPCRSSRSPRRRSESPTSSTHSFSVSAYTVLTLLLWGGGPQTGIRRHWLREQAGNDGGVHRGHLGFRYRVSYLGLGCDNFEAKSCWKAPTAEILFAEERRRPRGKTMIATFRALFCVSVNEIVYRDNKWTHWPRLKHCESKFVE